MPFKQDYLAADGITVDTYNGDGSATERIRRLYGSARQGSMSQLDAGGLWRDFFRGLVTELPHLPQTREAYDKLAIKHIRAFAKLLRKRNLLRQRMPGDFGIAQKMFWARRKASKPKLRALGPLHSRSCSGPHELASADCMV
jgi:hypothetical protein